MSDLFGNHIVGFSHEAALIYLAILRHGMEFNKGIYLGFLYVI